MSVWYLRYLDPSAAEPLLAVMGAAGVPFEDLGLVGIPVAVLGEQDAVPSDGDHGVTHQRELSRPREELAVPSQPRSRLACELAGRGTPIPASIIRPSDMVGCLGGDELVVICSDLESKDADLLSAHMKRTVWLQSWDWTIRSQRAWDWLAHREVMSQETFFTEPISLCTWLNAMRAHVLVERDKGGCKCRVSLSEISLSQQLELPCPVKLAESPFP